MPIAQPPEISVETATLGTVAAALSLAPGDHGGDRLHVHFAVERPDTAALIVDGGPVLDRALAATGTRLDAVSVEVRGEIRGEVRGEARGQGAADEPASHRPDPRDAPPEPRRDRRYRRDPPPSAMPAAPRDRYA